jgi:hypothetical protein
VFSTENSSIIFPLLLRRFPLEGNNPGEFAADFTPGKGDFYMLLYTQKITF